jgi:hypothetical protein
MSELGRKCGEAWGSVGAWTSPAAQSENQLGVLAAESRIR